MPAKRTPAKSRTKKSRANLKDLSVTAKGLRQKVRPIMGGKKITWT